MEILDKISLKEMLKGRKNCTTCYGKGYLLFCLHGLDATKFREVKPCNCVKQIVRVKDG